MKKSIIAAIAAIVIISQSIGMAQAASTGSAAMKSAIAKYKKGNYTGCLQDVEPILKKDPSNAMAQYYSAISYTRIGETEKARAAYDNVIKLNSSATLTNYSKKGLACLAGPETEGCKSKAQELGDMDKFVNEKRQLSPQVEKEVKTYQLERAKNMMNKEIQNVSPQPSQQQQAQPMPAVNQTQKSELPTDEEVGKAVKTLAQAGINIFANMPQTQFSQTPQNAELAQLNMLFGNNNNAQNYNNNMMNIMPYLLTQAQNGQGNVSPEIVKTMMMGSLMNSFNIDTTKDY